MKELESAIALLREEAKSGIPIITEGKRDEMALRELGIEGKISKIQGNPIHKIVEDLSEHKEVIILTDFDKAGRKLASQLASLFERNGVKPNLSIRRKIMSNTFANAIEDLK